MKQKQKAELLDGFLEHTTDKNLKENYAMLKRKVAELSEEDETVTTSEKAPGENEQSVHGRCNNCGAVILFVPVKAIARKSCSGSITEGKEYDIIRRVGDNIIVLDDSGMEIGFTTAYLKPIQGNG